MTYPIGTQVRLLKPEEIAGLAKLPRCYSNEIRPFQQAYGVTIPDVGTISTYDADMERYLVRFTNAWELWLLPQEFTLVIPLVEGGAE